MENKNKKIVRNKTLFKKIIFVDGIAGCGKTLFSPIIASFDQVELLNYAFEIEWICRLNSMSKIDKDAAITMIKMHLDLRLYGNMMGRDVNFRYSDLSSVFQNPKPLRYIRRIFSEGDMEVPKKIELEKPILNLTTHDLLPLSKIIFENFSDGLLFIDVERHPLFMIIQQTLNMERLVNNPRNIAIYFQYKKDNLPFWAEGWEELFLKSNFVEKAIYYTYFQSKKRDLFKKENAILIKNRILTIPFEKFVKNPNNYLKKMETLFGLTISKQVIKAMRKQNVPRKNIVDGIPLAIYKRCGWTPPNKNLSEKDEFVKRRQFAKAQGANKKSLELLDKISHEYEKKFKI